MLSLGQLNALREVVTLSVFAPFAVLDMKEIPTRDYLWAALFLLAAAFFMLRRPLGG